MEVSHSTTKSSQNPFSNYRLKNLQNVGFYLEHFICFSWFPILTISILWWGADAIPTRQYARTERYIVIQSRFKQDVVIECFWMRLLTKAGISPKNEPRWKIKIWQRVWQWSWFEILFISIHLPKRHVERLKCKSYIKSCGAVVGIELNLRD